MKKKIVFFLASMFSLVAFSWGFFGHKLIVEWSAYSLPKPLINYVQPNIDALKYYSVLPDVIKNIEPLEYSKHYIDLEKYDSLTNLQNNLDSCFQNEMCFDRGVLPYVIQSEFQNLIYAYKSGDESKVIYQMGILAHYTSDLCVPLHTTSNYDGQLTNQEGIHALWESYLPEKNSHQYQFFGYTAKFENNVEQRILKELYSTHSLVDELLKNHLLCKSELDYNIFGFNKRKGKIVKGFSEQFMECYHDKSSKEIEAQFIASIQLTSDLWYSAWVLAGKPDLNISTIDNFKKKNKKMIKNSSSKFNKRKHE